MRLHPALLIVTWCVFVAGLQRAPFMPLLLTAMLTLMLGAWMAGGKLLKLLRRTRWIMLSLLCIYAYTTPGPALLPILGSWSPVTEGLMDGSVQLMRLLAALAGLAVLLDRLHRLQLIAGLYSLFAPLRFLGLSRERCAIRLALTLHYAEVAMLRSQAHWLEVLQGLSENQIAELHPIALPVHAWTRRDWMVGGLLAISIVGLVLK